jgi:putative acetyltransferase
VKNSVMIQNNIRIREARNADSDEVKELVFGVLNEYGLESDPLRTDSDLDDIESTYFESGGIFYVLEDDARSIVGTAGLYAVDGSTCELRKMYLEKRYRGLGIGKELIEVVVIKAKELGFHVMVLETASVLKEAIRLYTNYGFREYQPKHLSSRCDQAYFIEL